MDLTRDFSCVFIACSIQEVFLNRDATCEVSSVTSPLLVPGLPGPANMSWGTELWVSLYVFLCPTICLCFSLSFYRDMHAYEHAGCVRRCVFQHHCPTAVPLFLPTRNNDIPRKPVHGGKPLTGVLPLRLLAAGDVLLSFGVSPLFPSYPTRVYVYSSLCVLSLASFLMKSSRNTGATVWQWLVILPWRKLASRVIDAQKNRFPFLSIIFVYCFIHC